MAKEEAGRDASRTGQFREVDGLRRWNSSTSGNSSSFSSAGTPPCPTGRGRTASGRRIILTQRQFLCLALEPRRLGRGLYITDSRVDHQREVSMITVSTGGNCLRFELAQICMCRVYCSCIYLVIGRLS